MPSCPPETGPCPLKRKSINRLGSALWWSAAALWITLADALRAATTNGPIPALRPPLPLLPPTFWELHGTIVIVGALLVLTALVAAVWWLRRPRLVVIPPPAALARAALEPLRGRPEDTAVVRAVSVQLRRYLVAQLGLAPGEWTTPELLAAPRWAKPVEEPLRPPTAALLHECDARQFAPVSPASPPNLVGRALALIAQWESAASPPGAPVVGSVTSATP